MHGGYAPKVQSGTPKGKHRKMEHTERCVIDARIDEIETHKSLADCELPQTKLKELGDQPAQHTGVAARDEENSRPEIRLGLSQSARK